MPRHGQDTYFYWLPNTSDPFNFAAMGMLEAYANANNEGAGGIENCNEYPNTTSVEFGLNNISQYDPSWNSFKTTSPSWGAYFGNAPVNCNFSVGWDSGDATLYWNP